MAHIAPGVDSEWDYWDCNLPNRFSDKCFFLLCSKTTKSLSKDTEWYKRGYHRLYHSYFLLEHS